MSGVGPPKVINPLMRLPLTDTVLVLGQPSASVPVTVKVVVAEGLTVVVPQVEHDSPTEGVHE